MSISFNGTSSKLVWSGAAVSAFPVTLFCWIKPASASASYMAFGVGNSGGADELDIFVDGADTNTVKAFSNTAVSIAASSTTGVQTTWQPAMAVYHSTTSRTIYYASGAAVTYTKYNAPNFAVFNRLVVGCRASTDSLFFSGEIAECAIWSSELTQANFNTLAAGGTPESVSSWTLVDAWSLESASALTGVNGRSLTATSATNGSTHPITRSGGSTDATADGVTLTGTATLTPGSATGESNASTPGVTFTGTSSFVAGSAFGEQNVIVPGCTLVSASAFIPGSAIGGADATADGAELVATSSFGAGGAIGEQNATALGVALTGHSIFVAGTATGDTGGVVVWPLSSDVRLGVTYGPTGAEYTGTMAEGGGTYPTAESIAAAVIAALQATTIPVDTKKMNGAPVIGDGSEANPWRGVGV